MKSKKELKYDEYKKAFKKRDYDTARKLLQEMEPSRKSELVLRRVYSKKEALLEARNNYPDAYFFNLGVYK